MRFGPGQTILRRYLRGPWTMWVQPLRVVSDDETGLLLWGADGSDFATVVDADGRTPHDTTPDRMRDPRLEVHSWQGDVLMLMPPGAAYSVWWFFGKGGFEGWYVNLEEPFVRRPGGVDTRDQTLDIVADPARTWKWKDLDEFAERIGNPLYFDADGAAAIRAEGERLTKLIDAAEFPFDDTFTGFRPGPAWPPLTLSSADLA